MPDTREERRKAYKQMIADIRARKMSTQDENQVKMENAEQSKKHDDSAVMNDEDRLRLKMENAKHLIKPNPSKEQADENLVKAEAAKQSRKSQAGKFWDGMN